MVTIIVLRKGAMLMRTANKKKAFLATSLASAALAGTLIVGGVAFAQTSNGQQGSLAQAIASKFNLNKDDVQKVIDQQHQDRLKQHLDKLVEDGKITSDQETKILAKLEEMKPKMEAARQTSDTAERKKALDALRSEMQQWEKDNGIPAGVVGPAGGMHHRGKMMSGNNLQPPQDTDQQVQ